MSRFNVGNARMTYIVKRREYNTMQHKQTEKGELNLYEQTTKNSP